MENQLQYLEEHENISEQHSQIYKPPKYRAHRSIQVARRIKDSSNFLNPPPNNANLPSINHQDQGISFKNIFDQNKAQTMDQEDPGIKLDNRGVLIGHTIAGKSDQFLREEQRRELLNSNYNSEQEQLSRKRAITQELKKNIAKNYAHKTLKQDKVKSMRSQSQQIVEDPRYTEEILSKNEVVEKIQSTLSRVRANSENSTRYNNQIYKLIDPGEQLMHTKDQRIINKFQNQTRMWSNIINRTSSIANKPAQNSVYMLSDQYRAKKETDQAIENQQCDTKRYGDRYWIMTLRHYERNEKFSRNPSQKVMDDLPHGFKTFVSVRQDQPLEIIRKPMGHSLKSRHEGIIPFLKSSKYLKSKTFNDPTFEVNDIQNKEQLGVEYLEVQGQNKLKQEIRYLIQDEPAQQFKLRQLKEDLDQTNQHYDDVIEANYDKKKLCSTGGLTFTKFSFMN